MEHVWEKIKYAASKTVHNIAGMIFLLSFTVNLFIEVISRHSLIEGLKYLFMHPLVFLVNMLILAVTYSVAMLIRRRMFWLAFVTFIWLLLGFTNGITLLNRMTPFTMADMAVLEEGIAVIPKYLSEGMIVLIGVAIFLVLAGFVLFFIKGPKIKVNYKQSIIIFMCIIIGSTAVIQGSAKVGIVDTYFPNLAYGFRDNGFPYSFMSSWINKGIKKPEGYSKEKIIGLFNKDELNKNGIYVPPRATDEEKKKTLNERPNILFVQLESFMDPNCIKGISCSRDPIPHFRKLKKSCSTGLFEVPAIGAGTANTEFECMTGISARFFGPGEYPYKEILKDETCESVPYDLKSLGYKAHAIHNHRGAFYSRNVAFTNLGFDTFTCLEYMNNAVTTPKEWTKDSILPEQIMNAVKSTKERDYVYTISVQGHGKYPDEETLTDPAVKLKKAPSEETKWAYEYYVNQVYEMDQFVKSLVDMFSDFNEKTVIVFYGDHIPAFDVSEEDMKDGRSLYNTEYIIWSNFGLEKKDKNCKAYMMAAEVLDRIDIHTGLLVKYTQNHKKEKNFNQNLEAVAYDMLYGKKYVYGGKTPFKKTKMKMGVKDIKIKDVIKIGDKYYIKGQNFTEFSKVSLDGEIISTTFLGPTMLATKEKIERSDIKRIKISQVEKNKEILSTTE